MGKFLVRLGTTSEIATNGTLGAIEVPIGESYTTSSTDVVDSARNSKGVIIFNPIRLAIRKIQMSWKVISNADYTILATFFNANKMFYAYYYDTDSGEWQTRHFYVGDREVDTIREKQLETTNVGGLVKPNYYTNFKISLIEV